jgi:hypothetical protein
MLARCLSVVAVLTVGIVLVGCDSAGPSPAELQPVAVDDNFGSQRIPAPGVLANDVDPDNPADPDDESAEYKDPSNVELTASLESVESGAEVTVRENGSFEVDGSGTVEFEYRAEDPNGKGDTATVTVTIQ